MRRTLLFSVTILLAALAALSPSRACAQNAATTRCENSDAETVARLTRDVDWLASDAREGREPATPGGEAAANYIVQRFTELGITPAGTDGFRQPFQTTYGADVDATTQVLLRVRGETRALTRDTDYRVTTAGPFSGDGRAVGPLVYAGHGLYSPEARWNDFARGTSVRGRIAVVLSGPPRPTDPARVESLRRANVRGTVIGKVRAARDRGAVAVVIIDLDRGTLPAWFIDAPARGIPVVRISRAQGAWLLGVPEASLVPETAETAPRRIATGTARVEVHTRPRTIRTTNVLGVVRARPSDGGTPPPGVLLVGAHYDHIGHGGRSSLAIEDHHIHNGADDNASGTVAVLELARRIARSPIERDVVFALFGAEELGLIGSTWMARHRTPAIENVAAMINLDMVGRLRDCRFYVEDRQTAREFAPLIERVNERFHFDARPWEPSRGPWGSSDHESFRNVGVPVLFFFTGLHDDYHRPSDDPPTLNYRGLGAVTDFADATVRALAPVPRFTRQ